MPPFKAFSKHHQWFFLWKFQQLYVCNFDHLLDQISLRHFRAVQQTLLSHYATIRLSTSARLKHIKQHECLRNHDLHTLFARSKVHAKHTHDHFCWVKWVKNWRLNLCSLTILKNIVTACYSMADSQLCVPNRQTHELSRNTWSTMAQFFWKHSQTFCVKTVQIQLFWDRAAWWYDYVATDRLAWQRKHSWKYIITNK